MKAKKLFYLALICLTAMSFAPCKSICEKNKVADSIGEVGIDGFSASQITDIVGIHWKLIELNGNKVPEIGTYFILHENNRVGGNGGCNSFSGTYAIENGNRISFSQIMATRRGCPNLGDVEMQFLRVFEVADNFTKNDDGTLLLNRAEMSPLARFVAVQ